MSRFKDYQRYLYQESDEQDVDIEEMDDKDTDTETDDTDDEKDITSKKKSSKKKKSKVKDDDDDEDSDVDVEDFDDEDSDEDEEDSDDDEDDKPKSKSKSKKKKSKSSDNDDDSDIDFDEECGDNCNVRFRQEDGDDVDMGGDSSDLDVDTGGDSEQDIQSVNESAKPKKKSSDDDEMDEDGDIDVDIDDTDEEDEPKPKSKKKKSKSSDEDDDSTDDEDSDEDDDDKKDVTGVDDEDDKPKSKSKSKKKKSKSSDNDDDSDIDFDEECGDDCNVRFKEECGDNKINFEDEGFFDRFRKDKSSNNNNDFEKEKQRIQSIKDPIERQKATTELMKKYNNRVAHVGESDCCEKQSSDHDTVNCEYTIEYQLNRIDEQKLATEREIMTELMEDLYKEYMMGEFYDDEDLYTESEEEEIVNDEEIVQERFIGGTGKQIRDTAKPIAKMGKKIHDHKHGVGKKGIIRNTIHRTKGDLKKGGIIYKLLTWPFLIIKNFVQTIYHKTKSFIAYRALLRGIEVKVNREITKIKKQARNLPKMAAAGGIGYLTTAVASVAKGEQLPLQPHEFIASEGAKLIEDLGHDTMLRGLTYKLATAFENGASQFVEALKNHESKSQTKVTPDMAHDAKEILTIDSGKATFNGIINMNGVNQLLSDIDEWKDITEHVTTDVYNGNEANVAGYLSKMQTIEKRYIENGKLNAEVIFNSKAGSVKIADFYEELTSKLTDKTNQLERGMNKLNELQQAIKDGNLTIAPEIEKTLAELNNSIQHTCNAFLEIFDTIDELGQHTMEAMKQYLGCLEQTSQAISHAKSNPPSDDTKEAPKKKRHKLFGKHGTDDEESDSDA